MNSRKDATIARQVQQFAHRDRMIESPNEKIADLVKDSALIQPSPAPSDTSAASNGDKKIQRVAE